MIRPDGTPCTGGAPGCVAGKACFEGECRFQHGSGDPSQVAAVSVLDVDVRASPERVNMRTARSDCCWFCEDQILEALVPADGVEKEPSRYEADGGLPLRRKFCGTVTKYGVNDERDSPRDILINILPSPKYPYPYFVAPFINTNEPDLSDEYKNRFKPSKSFNIRECLNAAAGITGKVIHAEVTPDEHFYNADGRFLPIESGPRACGGEDEGDDWGCQSELEQRPGTELCVYGVYALDHGKHSAKDHTQFCSVKDGSHDHPEIHPFDAVWWRHPERKGWIFGVFQDDSNRYSEPDCDDNGNGWSQAPRDLTFRFPFRFPLQSAPILACLRHVRTRRLSDGAPNTVAPMNIVTSEFIDPLTENTVLRIGDRIVLQVSKESATFRETHVQITGQIVGGEVVGQIVLRVAVGAGPNADAETLLNICAKPILSPHTTKMTKAQVITTRN